MTRRNKRKAVLVLFLVVLLALPGMMLFAGGQKGEQPDQGAAKVYKIRLHHGGPENDPTHYTAVKFKELAEEYSDGRLAIDIFPNLQLGTEAESLQVLRLGDIEMYIPYIGNLTPVAPSSGVLMLPYIWKSRDEMKRTVDAVYDEMNERIIKESGARLLAVCPYAYRVLANSVRPVETIDDIKGLKVRVSKSNIPILAFKAWGVNATPLAWGEVFTALQQKVIEGIENPYTVLVSTKFYEVTKYVTEIHYLLESKPIMMGEKFYQSLPSDLQSVVKKAADETREYISDQFENKWVAEAKETLVEKGMVLLGPPKDEDEWERLARSVYPQFYDSMGGKEWVEKFIEVKDSVN